MRFMIEKKKIVKVLSKVQGIASKNNNLAITENVFISANNQNNIKIEATNLETGYIGTHPADIENTGVIVINARKIYEILKEFPDTIIVVEKIKNKIIRISNKKIRYDVSGNNSQDLPGIIKTNEIFSFKINPLIFNSMIKKTVVISSKLGEKRAHVNGVLLEIENFNEHNTIIRMISTDGNRLSIVNYKINKKYDVKHKHQIIIPKKGLAEITKFIDTKESLDITILKNIIIVKKNSETLTIRFLEGIFPEYKQILDNKNESTIKLNRLAFAATLKRMSILINEGENGVLFTLTNNLMVITANNPEYGKSKEIVKVDYSGEKIEVAFNPKFFLDALSVIDEDYIHISLIDETKPCIIEGSQNNTYSYASVIMPMRL